MARRFRVHHPGCRATQDTRTVKPAGPEFRGATCRRRAHRPGAPRDPPGRPRGDRRRARRHGRLRHARVYGDRQVLRPLVPGARAQLRELGQPRGADVGFDVDTGRKSVCLGASGCSHKATFARLFISVGDRNAAMGRVIQVRPQGATSEALFRRRLTLQRGL